MLKIIVSIFFCAGTALAQSSADGTFVVQNRKHSGSQLAAAQMHEAEKLYQSACAVVKRDLHGSSELRPHFTVVIGADHNEVHSRPLAEHATNEIWLKQWSPALFTEGVVVLAFDEALTPGAIKQWGERALRAVDTTIDVTDFKNEH